MPKAKVKKLKKTKVVTKTIDWANSPLFLRFKEGKISESQFFKQALKLEKEANDA